MLAQAEHIPVHLGSMHMPLNYIDFEIYPGDQIVLNDPSMGGTHLPDITIYRPVFFESRLIGFMANRAHHSDIGGVAPGSIPGNSSELFQEGLIIPPIKIVHNNEVDRDILALILANTRTPYERRGDLMAQIGANNHGALRIKEFISNYGIDKLKTLEDEILKRTKIMLNKRMEILPKGEFSGKDVLEFNNDFLYINVNIIIGHQIKIDFKGTSIEPKANINAPLAVTHSAVFFFFRTILGSDIPINSAFYDFFEIIAPEGSIVNAPKNSPVVGGNVETSQRIVDTLINAFSTLIDLPAQSQGTMNNISFGNSKYTFYETIGGGAGAGNGYNGSNGVHVYMTNTKNTPVEVIEAAYPLLCTNYSLRHSSGGLGKWSGGEGIIKSYRAMEPCTFSIISDRRKIAPRGSSGGRDGLPGENFYVKGNNRESIRGKTTLKLDADDEIIILTPGGGGYGKSKD
jgi:N-methylhydantoinase B